MKRTLDLLLRMQPYANEIKELCRQNPDFANALKTLHSERFVSLGAIITSRAYSINASKDTEPDEIIGLLVYDLKDKIFKQDFIVNVEKKYKEFRIFTRYKGISNSKIFRDITRFYQEYPMYSKKSHHPSFEDIPDEIKPRAIETLKLANKLTSLGDPRSEISDEEYQQYDEELRNLGL